MRKQETDSGTSFHIYVNTANGASKASAGMSIRRRVKASGTEEDYKDKSTEDIKRVKVETRGVREERRVKLDSEAVFRPTKHEEENQTRLKREEGIKGERVTAEVGETDPNDIIQPKLKTGLGLLTTSISPEGGEGIAGIRTIKADDEEKSHVSVTDKNSGPATTTKSEKPIAGVVDHSRTSNPNPISDAVTEGFEENEILDLNENEASMDEMVSDFPLNNEEQNAETATPERMRGGKEDDIVIKDDPEKVEAAALGGLSGNAEKLKADLDKVKKLMNPKAHKIKNMELNPEHVLRRLGPANIDGYEVTLDSRIRDISVSREFMSKHYGGSTQRTFPNIGAKHISKHGIKRFMYVSLLFNPHSPQFPGLPGLFFDPDLEGRWPGRWKTFTRFQANEWQFMGDYVIEPTDPLSKEDWAELNPKIKYTWSEQMCKQSWGHEFCARVIARRDLGRKPTEAEWKQVLASKRHLEATPEDIRRALDSGEEMLAVSTMRCVGYDENFQRQVHDKWMPWKQENDKKQAEAKKAKNQKPVTPPKAQKRKKEEQEEVYRTTKKPRKTVGAAPVERVKERVYVPRGTRSRPIVL